MARILLLWLSLRVIDLESPYRFVIVPLILEPSVVPFLVMLAKGLSLIVLQGHVCTIRPVGQCTMSIPNSCSKLNCEQALKCLSLGSRIGSRRAFKCLHSRKVGRQCEDHGIDSPGHGRLGCSKGSNLFVGWITLSHQSCSVFSCFSQ